MLDDYDSDDDFVQQPKQSNTTAGGPKLEKKKTKSKTKTKKALTSSQTETSSRSGRNARMTAEERKFQSDLEEALRISEEESQSSSAEIVPPDNSSRLTRKVEQGEGEEMVSKKRKVEETGSGTDNDEVTKKPGKEEEVYQIEDNSSENKEEGKEEEDDDYHPVITKKKSPRKRISKKPAVISSDEEENVGEDRPRRKTPVKRTVQKKAIIESETEEGEDEEENIKEPKLTPKKKKASPRPLKDRNTVTERQQSNMFKNKAVKIVITPKKDKPIPAEAPSTPNLSERLGKLSSRKSDPATPAERKIPSWTPPARVGTPGSSAPPASPAIGLRLGLSRKFKSKPLHATVKTQK